MPFPNPIARKPGKHKKTPWDYHMPAYDERTSCYVSTGSHEGIGHTNPVGHGGPAKQHVSTLPFGKHDVMETSYVPPKQLDQEYFV